MQWHFPNVVFSWEVFASCIRRTCYVVYSQTQVSDYASWTGRLASWVRQNPVMRTGR